jgi:DnaK suppressor protein
VAAAAVGSNIDDEHDPEGPTIAFEREQLAARFCVTCASRMQQ